MLKITLVADNPRSWIVPYAKILLQRIKLDGYRVHLVHDLSKIKRGDLAFFLGCEKIVPDTLLALHAHNLVIHESALPKGKGWSPLTWQILQGKKTIPITLFEAEKDVDSGLIYIQERMQFRGDELVDELRHVQGMKTEELVMRFIGMYERNPRSEEH